MGSNPVESRNGYKIKVVEKTQNFRVRLPTDNFFEGKMFNCFTAIWLLFVTTPMFLLIVYAIMSSITLPVWAWPLFWCYVPALIIGVLLGTIARAYDKVIE